MTELSYPFNAQELMKRKKKLKRLLLSNGATRIKKNIAVLGGSTTNDIVDMLELFLLDNGIEPSFYQSEYAQYWQDAVFDNEKLADFKPDIIYIHTTYRNIERFLPKVSDSESDVAGALASAKDHFLLMWDKLHNAYHCTIIQNNFELPPYRLLGNADATDIHGQAYFVQQMNIFVSEYSRTAKSFYVNDINYVASCFGLDKWHDFGCWYLYKYAMALDAIPHLAFNLSNIIKAIFGKNKKALALDLDNTLWGGVVGDDGVENIEIGAETATAQAYQEFQQYIKKLKDIGIILTISSKNDYENAIAGLNHPDGVLKPDDFAVIKANWQPKNQNVALIAKELNIMSDAIVFVDDNPAERSIVAASLPVVTPPMERVEDYIRTIDRNGYFEVVALSEDDLKRNEMYKANAMRQQQMLAYSDYGDYLHSLEMLAEIRKFEPVYIQRIAQLTNKSNQFNVTTRRYTPEEIADISVCSDYIAIYGKLIDKFGDNGVVSVVIGAVSGDTLNIDLWIMSCRVLKRDMEYAMLDELVRMCRIRGVSTINGFYYPTAKNGMVKELYADFGFIKTSEDESGNTSWQLKVDTYENKNRYITVKSED